VPTCVACERSYPLVPGTVGPKGVLPGFCGAACEARERRERGEGFEVWWPVALCTVVGAVRLPMAELLAVDPAYARLNAECKETGRRYFELSAERKAYVARLKQLRGEK